MGGDHAHPAEPVRARPLTPAANALTVTVDTPGDRWFVLHVDGELDMVTAPMLAAHVTSAFTEGRLIGRTLVFDLTRVGFIASSGLAVLADAAKEAAARSLPSVRVVVTSRAVRRPLEVTGLDTVLATYADLAGALDGEIGPGPIEPRANG